MRELPLNDYVSIEQPTITRDGIGGEVRSWAELRAIWCRVADVSVKEFLSADEVQGRRTLKIRCYADDVSDVTPAMRVVIGSRTLQVDGVLKNAEGDRAWLMCWELTT